MKKDLKLLLWYLLCPLYIVFAIWFVLWFFIWIVLTLLGFEYFSDIADHLAPYPFDKLTKLRK